MSTVLVVDDQVSLLHTLEQSLLECGYDVQLASCPEPGRTLAGTRTGRIRIRPASRRFLRCL
jgi:DNA-binding NtrC family response regulator